MVSGWTIAGIIVAFLICATTVLGSFVLFFRKRKNVSGTFFVLVLGLLGSVFPASIANTLGGLMQLPVLMESSLIFGLFLYALLIAILDLLIRYYFVTFSSRSGMGKCRAISFSCGYSAGQCLMPMLSLFMYIIYAIMINQGTFLDGMEAGSEALLQAAAFQNELIAAPGIMYFTAGAEYGARALFYAFLSMALIRGIMEEKKAKSFGILFGIRAFYEIIYQINYGLCSTDGQGLYSEKTALVISILLSCAVIAFSLYGLRYVLVDFPKGNEKAARPRHGKQAAEERANQQSKKAWSEVQSMARPKQSIAELARVETKLVRNEVEHATNEAKMEENEAKFAENEAEMEENEAESEENEPKLTE